MPEKKKSEFAPVLKITLYLPDGEPQEYFNCTVGASLVPELEFYGTLRETNFRLEPQPLFRSRWLRWIKVGSVRSFIVSRHVRVTSTTLPYIIEEQLD